MPGSHEPTLRRLVEAETPSGHCAVAVVSKMVNFGLYPRNHGAHIRALTVRWVSLLFAIVVADPSRASAFACHGSKVSIETTSTGPLTIDFSIRNDSEREIVLDGKSLPWIDHHSIRFLRVNGDGGASESVYPPEDFPTRPPAVRLLPGASIHGSLNLEEFSPGLRTYLDEQHADLFWLYKVRGDQQQIVSRCAGWVLLPRNGKASP